MCEQTEVQYLDGDVVWVKLGSCWWPGRVKDVDELPEEILTSLKKKPIAAVKFFQEDTFEYVRNLNQICMYNCRRKHEFIKKGLDMYRAKKREGSKVMDKFPQDVATAEEITGGDPDIIRDSAFAPEERPDYRNIFGSDKKKEEKKGKHIGSPNKDKHYKTQSSANGRHSTQVLPLEQPRQATNPRFISRVKSDSEHEIRIRHQPVSTPARDPNGTPSPQYKCHLCDFTSSRLNVIVLHNKFHSADAANNGQSTPSRTASIGKGRGAKPVASAEAKLGVGRNKGRGASVTTVERVRSRSKTAPGTVFDTPKGTDIAKEKIIPRKRLLEEENHTSEEIISPKVPPVVPKSPEKSKAEKSRATIFGKRKGAKSSEKPAKKKKSDEEIREKLLADWTDEDEEQEEKEIELIKQELSKGESLSSISAITASEEDNASTRRSSTFEENSKPKDSSCFDFDETDDANLGSELEERAKKFVENRKIPRIIDDKGEGPFRRRIAEEIKFPTSTERSGFLQSVELREKDSNEDNDAFITNADTVDSEDTEKAFKNILEETTVPKLPEIPDVPAIVTAPTSNDTFADDSDEIKYEEKDMACENVTNGSVKVKEHENASSSAVLDEEGGSIINAHVDHYDVKEENATILAINDVHSEHIEGSNESNLEFARSSSSHNGSQDTSKAADPFAANVVPDNQKISARDSIVASSNVDNDPEEENKHKAVSMVNIIMEKDNEETAAPQSSIDILKDLKEESNHHEKETVSNFSNVAMEVESSSASVTGHCNENIEVGKPLAESIALEVNSINENSEKSDQEVFQTENNKVKCESEIEKEDRTKKVSEEIVEEQECKQNVQGEVPEIRVDDKESAAVVVEEEEMLGTSEKSASLETKLQSEELLTEVKEKEPLVMKAEDKELAQIKVEEKEPLEVKTGERESEKKEEVKKEGTLDIEIISQEPSSSQISLEDDEIELDINSMPVVMTDAIITEEPSGNKDQNMTVPVVLQSTSSSQPVVIRDSNIAVAPLNTVVSGTIAVTSAEVKSNIETSHIACSSTSIIKAQSPSMKSVKFQTVRSPSAATLSKVKTTSGTTLIPQKGGKLVVIQAPGQKSRYTVGKAAQQKVAVKSSSQQQIIQQAVGSGKVVILTKPQGGGQQKILTTALTQQQQRILTTGGKLQTQSQQRIITSTGAILTPVNPRSVVAKGAKFTPVNQQQMKALQGGKSLGTKFTVQSTQAKVILPSAQKTAVSQSSAMRVIGTLKPQSNTILIQTTQGTAVSSAKPLSTAAPVQPKISPLQSVQRPKLLTTTGVQRITLPVSGVKTITQAQPKVVGIRPSVTPRMVVQKVQSPGTVGVLSNISQVRKVSGVFPRTATIQKISQSTNQTPSLQKIQQAQTVHKVIPLPQLAKKTLLQKLSDVKPQVSKASEILVSAAAVGSFQSNSEASLTLAQPSMHIAQPSISVAPAAQGQSSGIIISSAPQSSIITNQTLSPIVTTAAAAATASVLTPEQIAQVVAATPAEQMGDGNAPTYVLVTIDDSGALQPYDNSSLLAYDGSPQTEATPRTLYIDPSSIGSSGDLENIILTIDNSASGSGTVLNLGQSNTVPINPVTSISLENQNTPVFNIISSSQSANVSSVPSSGGPNQDILAEALANTQVFQPDNSIQDSLTVVNSAPSAVMTSRLLEPSSSLHQTTMLLPSLSPVLPPPNPAGVLETSLTLNQPIMTPLEVPSAVTTLQAPPPVPTSLELPLTITQPALSVPSQPFSTLTVPVSTPIACISEAETADVSVSSTPINLNITEHSSLSTSACNPSMPLLSEETDPEPTATASASANAASSPSSLSQDQITIPCTDTTESESILLEKTNDLTALAEKQASEEESPYQESDKNKPIIQTDLIMEPPSSANKSVFDTDTDKYQDTGSSDKSSDCKEISSSSCNQITEVVSSDSDAILLSQHVSESTENINEKISNLMIKTTTDEFHDHSSHTSEQYTETPPSMLSYADNPKSTSSHSEDTIKQTSIIQEQSANISDSISLHSSEERHVSLTDDSNEPSHTGDPSTLAEAAENKLYDEHNSHEDSNVDFSSSSHATVELEGNSPTYGYDHNQESMTSNSTTPDEKQSNVSHSMPLLIDEGEAEVLSNPVEDVGKSPQKSEGLKRSSPYYNDDDDDISNSSSDMDPELKRVRLESERLKDQESLTPKPTPYPDLGDDNENKSDSDDDLPPALTPQKTTKTSSSFNHQMTPQEHSDIQPPVRETTLRPKTEVGRDLLPKLVLVYKKLKFEKDDIVWFCYNKIYQPAIVTSVSNKSSKVHVKTVNSPRKQKSLTVCSKYLLDFSDDQRNRKLLDLGKTMCPGIEEAYRRVLHFYCKKACGKNLSAIRFLTCDPDDTLYGMLPDIELNGISENKSEETDIVTQHNSYGLKKNEEEETYLIANPILTMEELDTRNKKAQKLLQVIESQDCWKHLQQIYKGKIYSHRHEMFMARDRRKIDYLRSTAGLSVFHDHSITEHFLSILRRYFNKLGKRARFKNYMYYVMVPEAIIFAIKHVYGMNEEAAIKMYNETSSELG